MIDIVTKIDEHIAQLVAQRDDLDRQIAQSRKAREILILDANPSAPLARVEPIRRAPVPRARTTPKGPAGPATSLPHTDTRHAHIRDLVLRAMQTHKAETHSELMATLTPTPLRHEVANALRDLRDRGLIAETGQTGAPISGRGRAPKRWRLVTPASAANTHARPNGVRRSGNRAD